MEKESGLCIYNNPTVKYFILHFKLYKYLKEEKNGQRK